MTRFVPTSSAILITATCLLWTGCSDRDNGPLDPVRPDFGAEWRLAESGIESSIRAMAANDTMLVAVGDAGIIYTSADGHEWTRRRESGANDALTDITWTGTQFIAVGFNGTLLRSPDGITWTYYGPGTLAHLYGVAGTDSLMIVGGEAGSIFTSTDGDIWNLLPPLGQLTIYDITCADNLWLACASGGKIFRSLDGILWEEQVTTFPSTLTFRAIAVADSTFYVAAIDESSFSLGRCSVYRSSNGSTWFAQSTLNAWYIWDLAWTGSELIAVGEGTNYHLGFPDGLLFSSPDASSWTTEETDAPFTLHATGQLGDEIVVAGGDGYILSGTSPAEMTIRSSGATMRGVVWDGNRFVAVTERGTVMTSVDGESWEEIHGRVSTRFLRLAWSGSRYVAMGGLGEARSLFSSPDGQTWAEEQGYVGANLTDVTFGNGQFLACGQHGTILLSSDGQSWSRHFVGDSVTLETVIWDGTRYLAAATDIVYMSDDGTNWTKPTVDPTDPEPVISRMIWTGAQYVAVGNLWEGPNNQGYVHTSTDAVHWTRHELGQQDRLYDLAWTGTSYVIGGRFGTLLGSSDGADWQVLTSGTDESLVDMAVAGDKAIIVGAKRTVLISP